MAQRPTDPPQRFSVGDWHASNNSQYQSAELEHMRAERARDEHERLRRETDERRARTQADVSTKLGQRINDVQFWHEEIGRKQNQVQEHIGMASETLDRLKSALRDTALPLETTVRCLANRERRRGIDLVHDNVQIELLKERDTIQGCASMLQRTIEQVTEQLRLLRKSAYNLDKDMADKNLALGIDHHCATREEGTIGHYRLAEQALVDSKSVAPPAWEGFTDTNLVTAESQCLTYAKLNGVSNDVLNQCRADILTSRKETNQAFERRIEETQEARDKLQDHFEKVSDEMIAVGDDITSIQQAIQAKIPALQLSQYRTAQRGERPNIELVRDPVHYRLISEAAELDDSIRQLQDAYAKAVKHYEALSARGVALKEDMETKDITLQIDRGECMDMREQMPDLWTGQ